MTKRKIIVVGGGAAGLMAAGQAAEEGANTLVLEKMKRPGRKLCITGKGRCNITNIAAPADFISHFGKTGNFLRQAFSRFFNTDLMVAVNDLGRSLKWLFQALWAKPKTGSEAGDETRLIKTVQVAMAPPLQRDDHSLPDYFVCSGADHDTEINGAVYGASRIPDLFEGHKR